MTANDESGTRLYGIFDEENGRSGYINQHGDIVVPLIYPGTDFNSHDGRALFFPGPGQSGFFNLEGEVVIKPRDFHASHFSEGLASFCRLHEGPVLNDRGRKADACGYIDLTGAIVIEPRFFEAHDFSDGLAAVGSNELPPRMGYINKEGTLVIPHQFRSSQPFSEGRAFVMGESGRWGIIDKSGDWVLQPTLEYAEEFSAGLAWVERSEDEYWFVNRSGEPVHGPYEHAWSFSEGLAAVRNGPDGSGFINRKGELEIALPYELSRAGQFKQGLAFVADEKGDEGYMDTDGNWVIEPRFRIAFDFVGPLASVLEKSGKRREGYINRKGEFVYVQSEDNQPPPED